MHIKQQQRGMRAPWAPAAPVGWDCMKIHWGLCRGQREREIPQEQLLVIAQAPHGVTVCPSRWPAPAGRTYAPGAVEQRQLPALISPCPPWSALPQVECPAQIPKGRGNKRQVAGCPPQQQSCSVFCREQFVSPPFSADCMSLLKTASSADTGTVDASLRISLPLLFSSCHSPFLSFLLLLRSVRKDWPFIDSPRQAQYFFLSLLADPSLTVGQG